MKCKDCKYFVLGGNWTWKDSVFNQEAGKVVVINKHEKDFGMCMHNKVRSDYIDGWMDRDSEELTNDSIYAGSNENRGHLEVGKNFGCIYFKEKTQ